MNLLSLLSSESGDKTEKSNRIVVAHCLEEPALLAQIAEGLQHPKAAVIGDCAEVFTKVAEDRPVLVVPYAGQIIPLLTHKTTRVRWEAMHATALIASSIPDQITPLLPELENQFTHETSIIVRDYIIETFGNYAKVGSEHALLAYPLLQKGLHLWDGRQRGRALQGLLHVFESTFHAEPSLAEELHQTATNYLQDSKGVVKKAAKQLLKRIEGTK